MLRLRGHIGMHVFSAVMLVMLVVAGLFGVAELADEMTGAPEGYSVWQVMWYVAMRVPGITLDNMGFTMLVGCLLGLGVLASQSELTVMRASGVSVLRIIWMVLRPMLLVMLVSAVLAEFLIPGINRYAEVWYADIGQQTGARAQRTGGGLWLRQDNDFLHFESISPDGQMRGFSRFQFKDGRSLSGVIFAPRASFSEGGWLLEDASITEIGEKNTRVTHNAQGLRWESHLAPELLGLVVSKPENMSIREITSYLRYLGNQAQDGRQFELVFWQKVLKPFGMIGLVLVAISFVFGPLRSTTMGYRLFTGVMVGVVFRFAQDLLGPTSLVFGFAPIIAVLGPIMVCWLIGIALLLRVR